MSENKIEEWCRKLRTSKDWPIAVSEIENVWRPITDELAHNEQVSLLTCLVEKDRVFRWLKLISHVIPEIFSEDYNFANLLGIIIDKIKGDMAQGDFIRSLIEIGERHPEKGISLYSFLIKRSNDSTIPYAGLILGGAGKIKFKEVFETIKTDIQNEKSMIQVACLKALRVAFEKPQDTKFPPEILDLLDKMWKSDDTRVRAEVIQSYIDFREYYPEICEQKLLEIVKNEGSEERFIITNRLSFEDLKDQSIEIKILHICSEDNSLYVLRNLLLIISQKGHRFLEDSLEIIRKILKKENYSDLSNFDYSVKKLYEHNPEACEKTFQKWYKSDPDSFFHYKLKYLLERIGRY
jgi:hypothetical protein